MPDSVFQFGWLDDQARKDDDRIYGVALATVINNVDQLNEARVQVNLPWMPGYAPWARVAVLSAGMTRGTYFIPQIGDEVLVAFNQGDVREPFIIGSLWNTLDHPPAMLSTDPVSKRLIRTPTGQQLVFDDLRQTVTITNAPRNTLTLGPSGASLEAGTEPPSLKCSVSMDMLGNVTIQGATSITLKAPSISIEGDTVSIKGSACTTVDGGLQCTLAGLQIDIG